MHLAFHDGPRRGLRDRAISAVVKWKSRGRFDHCELVIPSLAGNRWYSATLRDKGVRVARREQEPDYNPAHWTFLPVDGDAYKAEKWFREHMGQPFDVAGVWSFWLGGKFTGRDDHWFCSEACAAALGYPEAYRFDPNHLHAVASRQAP